MKDLKIEEKAQVLPGDVLAEGDYLPGRGCFKENDKVKSKVLGVVRTKNNLIRVVPMSGKYIPPEKAEKKGEKVIGRISGVGARNWWVDINSPYEGYLSLSEASDEFIDLEETDLQDIFEIGDLIYTEVKSVTKQKDVQLSMEGRICKKLEGGRIVRISPSKVPRLIGKGGSMVEMIKNATDTKIIIGQNGIVWISGDKMKLAKKAVKMVDKKSHEEGLTEKIEEMLNKEGGKVD